MALLTKYNKDEVPFKVEFIVGQNRNEYKVLNEYSNSVNLDFIQDLGLDEYQNISLKFTKKIGSTIENAKLYMDCFDFISDEKIIESKNIIDGEDIFIELGDTITIHRHLNNDVGVALIPGVYKIKVQCNNQVYYSQIQVNPKNIEVSEHRSIIKEIENNVKGLARDWVYKSNSIKKLVGDFDINHTNLDFCIMLYNERYKFENAIKSIIEKPYRSIKKQYIENSSFKVKRMDARAMKLNQIKNDFSIAKGQASSNSKSITYEFIGSWDNTVNRFLFNVVDELIDKIYLGQEDLTKVKSYTLNELNTLKNYYSIKNIGKESQIANLNEKLQDIDNWKEEFMILINQLKRFRRKLILKDVRKNRKVRITTQFIKKPGYNYFYRLYLKLKDKENFELSNMHQYNWKSTEVLYEYWTYIELIKHLKKLNFNIVNGWIYDKEKLLDNKTIDPNIPDGTSVNFEKDNFFLELIFNAPITKKRQDAISNAEPYWIRVNRNKPDFRLNVYKNGDFKKVVVLDAKYTQVNKFWKKKQFHKKDSNIIEQLKIYANNVYSVNEKNRNVVEMVIALCPTYIDERFIYDCEEDHSLAVATFKPKEDNVYFRDALKRYIYN